MNMFKFVGCSKKKFESSRCSKNDVWVRSIFTNMVFNPLALQNTIWTVLFIVRFDSGLHFSAVREEGERERSCSTTMCVEYVTPEECLLLSLVAKSPPEGADKIIIIPYCVMMMLMHGGQEIGGKCDTLVENMLWNSVSDYDDWNSMKGELVDVLGRLPKQLSRYRYSLPLN